MGIKKNLVLGGSGTIGKSLCLYLMQKGEEVINIDIKEGLDLRSIDLSKFKNVDYVWFLAWDVGGSKYLTNEKNLLNIINNNTRICQNTFSFLEETRIPFMFASSQLAAHDTPYGVTKLLGEEWTRILGGQICRFWNVYGWEEPGEKSHVIPDLIMQGLQNKKIELITDGQEERQFIYMDDCVENMYEIRKNGASNVDITNGEWLTIEKVAQTVGGILNVPVRLGTKKGYNNKIPNSFTYKLNFKSDLRSGIEKIIEQAKLYINDKND